MTKKSVRYFYSLVVPLCLGVSFGVFFLQAPAPAEQLNFQYEDYSVHAGLLPFGSFSVSSWDKYRDIKLKNKSPAQSTPSTPKAKASSEDSVDKRAVVESAPIILPDFSKAVTCPTERSKGKGTWSWYRCTLNGVNDPYITPHGIDFPMSYMTPAESRFTPENPARIRMYMHPDDGGIGHFVTGASSFAFSKTLIEIHSQEEKYSKKGGGWWGFSGKPVENYNGRRMAASLDYVLDKYGDRIDLDAGIELVGVSLGGAGAFHQAMILPKYQNKIAIANNIIGLMMIPKNHHAQAPMWGTRYDEADIRIQWEKVQDVHFIWRGGANDNYERFDTEFIDICEQRKISCSLAWLQSGHSTVESGYSLKMNKFTNLDQNVALNKILPVITNNSSNHHGVLRGHHNRSVTWNFEGITDTEDEIKIPLQYVAEKHIGKNFPDQPNMATFSVTPRHVKKFDLSGDIVWSFGDQSGVAQLGSDGLLTIDELTLNDGAGYKVLFIKKSLPPIKKLVPLGNNLRSIVYTRVPRTTETYTGKYSDGTAYTIGNMDFMDSLPEVSRITSNFNAPGQLVIRDPSGVETVIYDCMNTARPCVPVDPSVSLDGTRIAFTVMSANSLKPPWPENRNYPNKLLSGKGSEAQIYIYDIAAESLTAWPHTSGIKDISPIWLPDGRMMFGSTRNGFYGPNLHQIGSKRPKPRLFIADVDGSNIVDVSQHELSGAIHPFLTAGGRVAFSSFWMSHNLPYVSTNGSINWPGTTDNMWVLMDTDRAGGDITSLLGGHKSYMGGANSFDQTMKAMHFIGQRENEDLCVTNYYRANNLGLGSIICFPLEAKGVEGPIPSFVPRNHYSVAEWSTSEDSRSRKENGMYLGKVGWPEGTLDGQLIMSVGRGYCTQVATSIPNTPKSIGHHKGCDVGIYKTTVIPSKTPNDLALIVDEPEWHEFGARVVRARAVAMPQLSKTADGDCQIASSDAGSTDAHNYKGYKFNYNYSTTANNGSEIDGLDHRELVAIRFYEILPNKTKSQSFKNSIGNKVKLLGDVPLLADNSFKAQLPCDTPYLMAGIDKDGRVIKRDQIAQSLRPGEKRVCGGCHLHSKEGRRYEQSLAFSATAVPLLTATNVPTFTNDILPIFESRCTSCHTDDVPLTNYNKLVWDFLQKYVPADKKLQVSTKAGNKMFGLQRPYTSKYVNNMYARESLLYWKAANKRTDGRADDTYDNDIDFGANHPTKITPIELKAVGDWLDSGAQK